MKHIIIKSFSIIFLIASISCSTNIKEQAKEQNDNTLIKEMYQKDIEIRELDSKTDTVNLEEYDKKHREKIFQLLAFKSYLLWCDMNKALHTEHKYILYQAV